MNHTPNYNLSQWAKSDQVKMEDFNADNTRIDGAIKAQADALAAEVSARQAAVQSVNSALAGRARVAAGYYNGNNSSSQTIYTGFTPKAVYVCTEDGRTYISGVTNTYYGGLAVTGSPAGYSDKKIAEIVSGGFQVFSSSGVGSNQSRKFHYVAIG